jgi:GNAT superfamily N-acetyltransferase
VARDVSYAIGERPSLTELSDLRASVGYARHDADYPRAFEAYSTMVTARDAGGRLVGWCALVSDGVRHSFFVDVIVRGDAHRRGIGRALVARAIEDARQQGISLVHADFTPENRAFYVACDFEVGLGAILRLS